MLDNEQLYVSIYTPAYPVNGAIRGQIRVLRDAIPASKSDALPAWAVAAAVLGSVFGTAALAAGVVLVKKHRNRKAEATWNHVTLGEWCLE